MFAPLSRTGRRHDAGPVSSTVTPGPCALTVLSLWTTTPIVTRPLRQAAP